MSNIQLRIDKLTSEIAKWKHIQETTTDDWMTEYCKPFLHSLEQQLQLLKSTQQSLSVSTGKCNVN